MGLEVATLLSPKVKNISSATFACLQNIKKLQDSYSGDNREGEIPDSISNSEVKSLIADGTIRKSMGE